MHAIGREYLFFANIIIIKTCHITQYINLIGQSSTLLFSGASQRELC